MKEILTIILVYINQNSIFIFQKGCIKTEGYQNPLFGIEPDQRKFQVFLDLHKVEFLISIYTSHTLFLTIEDTDGAGNVKQGSLVSSVSRSVSRNLTL